MKTIEDLKVGDTVWVVDTVNGRGNPVKEYRVAKVGTKLITIDSFGGTFRKENLRKADAYAHDLLILDITQYEKDREIELLRKRLLGLDWFGWKDVSAENISKIAAILGM